MDRHADLGWRPQGNGDTGRSDARRACSLVGLKKELLIQTVGDKLVLAGQGERGPHDAVYTFLKNQHGSVRTEKSVGPQNRAGKMQMTSISG